MLRIVLATSNPGKVQELNSLLTGLEMEVVPQSKLRVPDIPETGLSFVENAILKARHACSHTGLPAIADDSGLEVDALEGAPGIYSARYAGTRASDRDNVAKLLDELGEVPSHRRTARFICLLVYLRHSHDPTPVICQGAWEGRITHVPRGDSGFGYDPVFLIPTAGKTAAELPPGIKNRMSHRGKALAKLVKALGQTLPSKRD